MGSKNSRKNPSRYRAFFIRCYESDSADVIQKTHSATAFGQLFKLSRFQTTLSNRDKFKGEKVSPRSTIAEKTGPFWPNGILSCLAQSLQLEGIVNGHESPKRSIPIRRLKGRPFTSSISDHHIKRGLRTDLSASPRLLLRADAFAADYGSVRCRLSNNRRTEVPCDC